MICKSIFSVTSIIVFYFLVLRARFCTSTYRCCSCSHQYFAYMSSYIQLLQFSSESNWSHQISCPNRKGTCESFHQTRPQQLSRTNNQLRLLILAIATASMIGRRQSGGASRTISGKEHSSQSLELTLVLKAKLIIVIFVLIIFE